MTAVLPIVPGQGPLAVSARGLTKTYGKVMALQCVDLQVPEGAVYVLAGSNGAGKTTFMEALLNLVDLDARTAEIFGLDSRTQGAAARAQVGYVSARPDWGYGWMTVGHLVKHHAALYPALDDAYAARLARVFELPFDHKFGALCSTVGNLVRWTHLLHHGDAVTPASVQAMTDSTTLTGG